MTDSDEQSRILASCDDCGAIYAAIELSDGNVLPIGSRDGCRCGSASFSRVTEGEFFDTRESDPEPEPRSESETTDG